MGRLPLACGSLLLFALACDDGSAAHGDAGLDAGADAGKKLVWMPKMPEIFDAGGRQTDSGQGGTMSAEGGIEGRSCAMRRTPLPDLILPRCSAATRTCVEGCLTAADGDACREACLAADETPAETNYGLRCDSCVYLQLFACIDQADCHDAVAQMFCCFEDKCPAGSPEGCSEERCGTELNDAVTCGYYADMSCLDFLGGEINRCFATTD